jgi:hypothetical protein
MKELFQLLKQLSQRNNQREIERYFTLEEAAETLGWVKANLHLAYKELDELYDNLVLTKRLYAMHYADRLEGQDEMKKLLSTKANNFEATMENWGKQFEAQGVFLRDLQEGIVEFPYKTSDGDSLFLCWQHPEEGVLYFRESDEDFSMRRPITFLPN